ncbi:glycosyltransferase family 1 protein [Raineyella sp.]|uniref:D-inositol-3-phosphate glycosyltransferase n=1 Tax=bioreactor metagenome TaxID=1076179 RepID=A0A644XGJ0_9ZZZZ|nr:glycosyltransferase family 1 protein [Raineyella sp.]MEA5153975.1 glycosyltransferase family 1 protein [Raineyella sp.]
MNPILYDSRWSGRHGIGRFSAEVRRRLPDAYVTDLAGHHPVSPVGMIETELKPHVGAGPREPEMTFFSPGYTPSVTWRGRRVFTVHDLIHLDVPTEASRIKAAYYSKVVRPLVRRHDTLVLTVSEFSRLRIAEWADVDPDRILTVGNGVDDRFSPAGRRIQRNRPYVLHLGNSKPHKNLYRLVAAMAKIPDVDLILSSAPEISLYEHAHAVGLEGRLICQSGIPEEDLAAWLRGAAAVAIPSLYEGFGLPALEGMACGVPVVASNGSALTEVVGDAGILVEPTDVDSIMVGLATALGDEAVRAELALEGPRRAQKFRWDEVARCVQGVLGIPGGNAAQRVPRGLSARPHEPDAYWKEGAA